MRSAPVIDCQNKIGTEARDKGAAIIINSGNANAFTGRRGEIAVKEIVASLSTIADLPVQRIFSSSTGVIGELLEYEKIIAVLNSLFDSVEVSKIGDAARAIMTTDTFPKGSSLKCDFKGNEITISGIAKGSGMIAPNMGTMLVYIFTDALIEKNDLQSVVADLNEETFNCITVDSDTSTSDTLLVGATGKSGIEVNKNDLEFREGLRKVMLDLAHQVVCDGEGASKFVEVCVSGAADQQEAKVHAMSIANSPLVKTAIAGEDPNWGRVVMAIGKSGASADRDKLSIRLGDILVAEEGWVCPSYKESSGAEYMKQQHLKVNVDLGIGTGQATVWTCDLTHSYIEINADYRS
jgi:glutamate N-acetyltransferase/amino-acid N-acetyltransferase